MSALRTCNKTTATMPVQRAFRDPIRLLLYALGPVLPVIVSVTILSFFTEKARPAMVVSPSGFENTEGNAVYAPDAPFPAAPPFETPSGWRAQELHLHSRSAFASLGPGPFEITGFAWRPDVSVNAPISTEWEFTLYASTTPKEKLSTTFADNYGPDGAVQVFVGTVPFETDGVPDENGLHGFDYVIEFDTSYVYNPMEGNLLFEYVSPDDNLGDLWIWADGDDQTNWTTLGLSASAEESLPPTPGLWISRFTVVPEPTTLLLWIVACAWIAIGPVRPNNRR